MGITAYSGPVLSYGQTLTSSAGTGISGRQAEYNSQRGPSLFDLGLGMMDPRVAFNYTPGEGVTNQVMGFPNGEAVVDIQGLVAGSSIAFVTKASTYQASQSLTLAAVSSANGTYTTTIVAPENGATVSVTAIDSTAAVMSFSQDGTVAYWNPAAGSGRCLTFTATGADGGAWTIIGRDMYGYKMTEQVTVGTSTINSKRAFKYISAIYASSVLVSTSVQIGLSQIFGMPLAVTYMGPHVTLAYSSSPYFTPSATVTTSAADPSAMSSQPNAFLVASTATADSSTTTDVRGLWTSSAITAATSCRIMIRVKPTVAQLAALSSNDFSALFGVTQFSSV